MLLTVAALGLAVVASLLRGGRPRQLAHAELAAPWLLFVGLALQIVVDAAARQELLTTASTPSWLLLAASQLAVLAWLVRNRHLPGVLLVGAGLAANAVVMAANGAMPVAPQALAALGADPAQVTVLGKHTLLHEGTRLPWLADVIPVRPLRTVVSVGDVLLAAGLVPLVHRLLTWPAPDDAPLVTSDG